ncbi:hypothetical protein COW36_20815 [bacterium (Candidatus Blackallbacteria) CG17_big_fil_post_rev_8_21_14_2_50_48_46]|uniref:Uncharacterized protein n=1 Tax=bacterium (Candidatus Blackallbacteria) CG17_big_fil_post_rev_8_21_14_2_50_48_46 TaxID=2014261 RepID=A0A2M7FZ20_9BACT|nr:MAG: hypothetical protein COW64_14125 [bacterium (Candidatus Blackallbacteria) CG18_big_fil_WC_8_21_14_2_50_49_26]PIW14485.1 MAG: hypothetical protein COW36_20815 [bacterium (Candidatus Blackallbacteria) CG17_big_fil_post_rev_8_21_14_2_50_48_46]PIW47171.1 MAG: hypothetical protein COW20_13260 [bacterium (Candidatus Blackallbacteria) CG13_big_fil_rev_8_21_14_2_50_49_14]
MGILRGGLLLLVFLLATPVALAAPRPDQLPPAEIALLKSLKQPVVVPGFLPRGFHFKVLDLHAPQKGKAARYRLDYRCFCGGMNYGFSILAQPTPLKVLQSKLPVRMDTRQFGKLQYFHYDPTPVLGLREPFYLSAPFGKKKELHFHLLSNFEGAAMPEKQFVEVLKNLTWLK